MHRLHRLDRDLPTLLLHLHWICFPPACQNSFFLSSLSISPLQVISTNTVLIAKKHCQPSKPVVTKSNLSKLSTMGFFKSCVDALLRLGPLSSFRDGYFSQQPLPFPVPSNEVLVHPQGHGSHHGGHEPQYSGDTSFVCRYPTYHGWESCNGPDSRKCWIRDPNSRQPLFSQFDVNTDYEAVLTILMPCSTGSKSAICRLLQMDTSSNLPKLSTTREYYHLPTTTSNI